MFQDQHWDCRPAGRRQQLVKQALDAIGASGAFVLEFQSLAVQLTPLLVGLDEREARVAHQFFSPGHGRVPSIV